VTGRYILYGAPGYGSMIVEAAFAHAGLDLDFVDLKPEDTGWDSARLGPLNPLGQTPTMIFPSGEVMTESAAIILHLADIRPGAGLAPPPDDRTRAQFLRWLLVLAAAVYPTFTYGDVPERWVRDAPDGAAKLRAQTDAHREMLYQMLERAAGAPWFLGDRFSALDIYLWQMSHWRPRRPWFAAHCPKLYAIATRAGALGACRQTSARNGY